MSPNDFRRANELGDAQEAGGTSWFSGAGIRFVAHGCCPSKSNVTTLYTDDMKILLAIDESDYSRAALDSVLKRPWPDGTTFRVLSVVEPYHPDFAGWDPRLLDEARKFQQSVVDEATRLARQASEELNQKYGENCADFRVVEGRIAESIIHEATDWHAELLVMGSHGRSGMSKLLLGSVSAAVVAHAPCSIEVVKRPV